MTIAAARPRGLLLVLGTLTAFAPLSIDMYLPSLPTLTRELAGDTSSVQLTLSAFLVGFALAQLFYGPMSDRFGRKLPLLGGVALYVVASAGCVFVADVDTMIALRLLQGFGGAAAPTLARAVVRDLYDREQGARALSFLFLIMAAAPMLAPLLGGQVLVWLGWRWIFGILTVFGAFCLALAGWGLAESLPKERRTTHNPLEMAVSYGELLRSRQYLGYSLASGLSLAGMFAYISGSPFVFIEVYGVPPQYFGFLFGTNVAGMMLLTFVNTRLVGRVGVDRMLTATLVWSAVMTTLLLVAATAGASLPVLFVPLFLFLMTIGTTASNATAGALAGFPHMAGTASGFMGTLQYTLGATGGALVGLFHDGTPVPMAAVVCGCGLLALLARALLVRAAPQPAA